MTDYKIEGEKLLGERLERKRVEVASEILMDIKHIDSKIKQYNKRKDELVEKLSKVGKMDFLFNEEEECEKRSSSSCRY